MSKYVSFKEWEYDMVKVFAGVCLILLSFRIMMAHDIRFSIVILTSLVYLWSGLYLLLSTVCPMVSEKVSGCYDGK